MYRVTCPCRSEHFLLPPHVDLYASIIWMVDVLVNVCCSKFVCYSDERFVLPDIDDLDEVLARRRELIIRGAALVGVISAWMSVRFRHLAHARPSVTYGPMSSGDEQR